MPTVICTSYPAGFGKAEISGGTVDPPTTMEWNPGQIAKIEDTQYYEGTADNLTHSHMPKPYQPNNSGQADSIWGELDRLQWLRGIMVKAEWGKIEKSPGVFTWDFLDFVFDTVRGLTRPTGQNKKVILLLDIMHPASLADPVDNFPPDLMTQPAANGGYYKDPVAFPPSQTNPVVNAKKWDHAWCYEGTDASTGGGGAVMPRGYNFRCDKFAPGFGTNVLKTRFYAFIDALAAKFGNDEVFGGFVVTESAIGTPFVSYQDGNSRNLHFEGRLEILKYAKSKFPRHWIAECANFDTAWYNQMTSATTSPTNGMIKHKLGFSTPNIHIGANLKLGNILPVLSGKVPVVMQVQPFEMKSFSGNQENYYNWPSNPTQLLSAPTAEYPGASNGFNNDDPPTAALMMQRIRYFNSNYVIFQRNLATETPDRLNWPKWKTYMNGSIYANDPAGGMTTAEPDVIG